MTDTPGGRRHCSGCRANAPLAGLGQRALDLSARRPSPRVGAVNYMDLTAIHTGRDHLKVAAM